MKTRLFLISLFISVITFAQVPTTGLLSEYEFTNGSLADPINGDDFVQTGSALLAVSDKFGSNSNAIDLNGDYLTRPSINYSPDVTLSFWLQTTTNDANVRTVIDDKSTTSGFVIYLQDGKVGISATHQRSPLGWPVTYRSFNFLTNTVISDGEWHHVAVTIEFDEIRNIANQLRGHTFNIDFHIDLVTESFLDSSNGTTLNSLSNTNNFGNVTVANNRTNTLIDDDRYLDAIDDIYFYNRLLTNTEVEDVAQNGGYCFTPEFLATQLTNITETTFDITLPEAGNFDVAYVPSGQPISNATITSVTSTISTHTISGLSSSSIYDVYLREECSGAYDSDWSEAIEIRTEGVIYVNALATGNNNGTSFTDGFVSLQDALAIVGNDQEIWIAAGTYIPDASDRYASFLIANSGVKIYGGFDPSDTQISQRDYRTNETILSGDLLANDNATIAYSEATRNDNSYKVVYVNASNFTIDGVTIANGHANSASGTYQSGSGLTKEAFKTNLTIENCTFKNNVAIGAAAGIFAEYKAPSGSGYLKITNSIFDKNLSRYGTAIYSYTNGITNSLTVDVVNSLFTNNTATDNGASLGYAGSAGWIRAYNSGSTVTSTFINNTYANNKDDGTAGSLTNSTRATLGVSQNLGTMTSFVDNCIFWNNKSRGANTTAKSISAIATTLPSSISVGNSIDEDDFSLIAAGDKVNTSTADPLFTNSVNNDFTLQASSPGVDAGNGAKVPVNITTDLNQNPRFYNGAVDMGPYEKTCTSTCYTLTINVVGDGYVENSGNIISPSSLFEQNTVLSLIPINNLGYQFYGWSGDATGNTNPLSVTMDSDKTITVTFIDAPIFVDADATGNNNGSSWQNAFTKIEDAIAAAAIDDEIWVAEGTYYPPLNGSDSRKSTFLIPSNTNIYGGFNGTEFLISQRDPNTYSTVLSGDLNGDDNSNIIHTETTRQDNVYHIMSIRGSTSNIVIDGFTISGGNANGSTNTSCSTPAANQYYDIRGGAIYVNPYVTGHVTRAAFKNCVLENNTGTSVAVFSAFSPCGVTGVSHDIDFESCIIRNNYSNDLSAFLYSGSSGYTIYSKGSIVNSLFHNNTSSTNSGALYLGTSTANGGNTSGIDVDIINSTFSNNTGVNGNTITMVRASNSRIQNSIIYGNGSATPFNISTSGSVVSNSIVEGGQQSGLNSDPLFTNLVTHNYTVQTGSPAIDTGDNTKLPAGITADLLNNTRIYNTTIDMGCYEYDPSLSSISVSPIVYLQGAFTNPNVGEETLMRDDLRVGGLIPTTSTYADGLTCNASVFTPTGANAIVDWVWVELRDAGDNSVVIASQSALLQRDGDVVGVDGVSPLVFDETTGNYFVVVSHRSHLGIMSAATVALSGSNTVVDLSANSASVLGTTNAVVNMTGVFALVAGDFDENSQIQNTDINSVILLLGGAGYNKADVDMNGQIQNSDINAILYPNLGKGQQF